MQKPTIELLKTNVLLEDKIGNGTFTHHYCPFTKYIFPIGKQRKFKRDFNTWCRHTHKKTHHSELRWTKQFILEQNINNCGLQTQTFPKYHVSLWFLVIFIKLQNKGSPKSNPLPNIVVGPTEIQVTTKWGWEIWGSRVSEVT